MAKAPVPLTSLSEEQRAEAYARFEMLRPALEEGVPQAQIARTHRLSKSAVQRWVRRYREQGLVGLVTTARKEEVLIRYDPADLGEIHVFYQDRFLCRAICAELSDRKVSLKEIEKARSERRKQVRAGLRTRAVLVDRYVELHHVPPPAPKRWWRNPRQSKRGHDSRSISMTNQDGGTPPSFVETKSYRRFGEMCDASFWSRAAIRL
jgi:transposase-like protein